MKKFFLLLFVVVFFSSCGTSALYNWNKYEDTSYAYYKTQTPEAIEALLKTYEKMIKNQNGTRKVVPPGIYAEYGYLLIKNGKKDDGIEMLRKEISTYPESQIFIERIINQLEK